MCPDTATLSAWFDGELPDAVQASVETHIQNCPACQATVDLFASQRDLLNSDTPGIHGEGYQMDRFWDYVGKSRLSRIHGPRRIAVPLPLAAAAVFALLVASVLNFIPLGKQRLPDVVVVDSRPLAPTVVSLSITPGELDDFFAILEGTDSYDTEAIHTLPAEFPVARFGDPQMVRSAIFEGAP